MKSYVDIRLKVDISFVCDIEDEPETHTRINIVYEIEKISTGAVIQSKSSGFNIEKAYDEDNNFAGYLFIDYTKEKGNRKNRIFTNRKTLIDFFVDQSTSDFIQQIQMFVI